MRRNILKENIINSKHYRKLCSECGLIEQACICHNIRKITLKTKVSVIIPDVELKKTSNTGILAKASLTNSNIYIRGKKGTLFNPNEVLEDNYENLILYTGGRALTENYIKTIKKPINLIVPDGTWTTAPKIIRREPKFYNIPKVSLVSPPKSMYRVRKHPTPNYISTFEAIIYALEIIENNSELKNILMKYFLMKTDMLLWLAGKLPKDKVTGGVPQSALNWRKGIK